MVLVFVRIRCQQHAHVLVHIDFRVVEIIGKSLENQLIQTSISDAIDNYVIRFIHVCERSVATI